MGEKRTRVFGRRAYPPDSDYRSPIIDISVSPRKQPSFSVMFRVKISAGVLRVVASRMENQNVRTEGAEHTYTHRDCLEQVIASRVRCVSRIYALICRVESSAVSQLSASTEEARRPGKRLEG